MSNPRPAWVPFASALLIVPGRVSIGRADLRQEQSPVRAAHLVGARDSRTCGSISTRRKESLARRLAALEIHLRRIRSALPPPVPPSDPDPALLGAPPLPADQRHAGLGVGGGGRLTELVRVACSSRTTDPGRASHWVSRHELTHAYMLEKLARVMRDHTSQPWLLPAVVVHRRSRRVLRHHVGRRRRGTAARRGAHRTVRSRSRTATTITGTVLMYKEGQSPSCYAPGRALRVGEGVRPPRQAGIAPTTSETVFRLTYGVRLADADRDWYSRISAASTPRWPRFKRASEQGERLTHHRPYNLRRARPAHGLARRQCTAASVISEAHETGVDLVLSEPDKKGRRHEHRLLTGGASPDLTSRSISSRTDPTPRRRG